MGVKIDDLTMAEALSVVEKWIWNPGKQSLRPDGLKHYVVTPNPEIVVAAQKDPAFKKVLNDADLSIPDGAGLKLSKNVRNTFSGTDFMESLIRLSAEKGFTTGFLGGKEGVAKRCAECLSKKYPGLKVAFAESGGIVDKNGKLLKLLKLLKTDILFVAFGHLKQEKWLAANLKDIPVKVAMGVGGSFDYFSGTVPRAPRWMRAAGLEWLFRLIIQPWRIKRQLALIEYLWLLTKQGR